MPSDSKPNVTEHITYKLSLPQGELEFAPIYLGCRNWTDRGQPVYVWQHGKWSNLGLLASSCDSDPRQAFKMLLLTKHACGEIELRNWLDESRRSDPTSLQQAVDKIDNMADCELYDPLFVAETSKEATRLRQDWRRPIVEDIVAMRVELPQGVTALREVFVGARDWNDPGSQIYMWTRNHWAPLNLMVGMRISALDAVSEWLYQQHIDGVIDVMKDQRKWDPTSEGIEKAIENICAASKAELYDPLAEVLANGNAGDIELEIWTVSNATPRAGDFSYELRYAVFSAGRGLDDHVLLWNGGRSSWELLEVEPWPRANRSFEYGLASRVLKAHLNYFVPVQSVGVQCKITKVR